MQKETATWARAATRALMLKEPGKRRGRQLLPKQGFGFEFQLLLMMLQALASAQWMHFVDLGKKKM